MEPIIIIKSYAESVYIFSAVVFTLAMIWESFAPRRVLTLNVSWRWTNNFTLGALNWYLTTLAATWFSLWLATWSNIHGIGLLAHWKGVGTIGGMLLLLLLTQFVSYWIHRAFHRFAWLWPLHAVHHSDVDVDVSTSYRHHPLEPLLTLPITAPVVLLLGVSPESVLFYRLFAVAATVFSHSNINLPASLDHYLRKVILTPDYHRLHHCSEAAFTNSNYGSLLPWFDYLFGTAKHRLPDDQETMELGLEYLRDTRDSRLDQQLSMPLRVARLRVSPS